MSLSLTRFLLTLGSQNLEGFIDADAVLIREDSLGLFHNVGKRHSGPGSGAGLVDLLISRGLIV